MGQVLGQKSPKANKPHDCYWCGEKIIPGETYSQWTWVDRGNADTVRCHSECATAWNTLDDPEDVPERMFCRGCTCEKPTCSCKQGRNP